MSLNPFKIHPLDFLRRASQGITPFSISEFFQSIANDPTSIHFRPHPFTKEFAESLWCAETMDYYALLLSQSKQICGYGMLRGWDEGWTMPSLGIYISPNARNSGASSLLMDHLHNEARARGASAVRLKVNKVNHKAICLYRKMNYVFKTHEGESLIGILDLQ
jgi:ribosomal protein S18 acetylase RimI-like enzyme